MKTIMGFYQQDNQFNDLEKEFPQVDFVYPCTLEELAQELPDAEILVMLGTKYSPQVAKLVLDLGKNIKWVQSTTTGVDAFLKSGYPHQAVLTKGAGIWDVSVAEHVLAFILALTRHIPHLERNRQAHAWDRDRTWNLMGSLAGKTVGIAGYGNIGKEIAQRLNGFNVKINAYVRSLNVKDDKLNKLYFPGEFNAFLKDSDIIILMLPCTQETEYIIDTEQFDQMKPGAIIINAARGKLIRESALVQALKQGKIAAAGIDVFEEEPLPATSELWDFPNIILSPHCAATGDHDILYTCRLLKENIKRYLNGMELLYMFDKIKGY
ncbi:D-2-hydroxyacid dehydrogenase [Candidatus Formimonas warabiya]|uniref:D-isomer specific 2-hydroxyacid dehydrogenase NAD-binding domain-containing protein n=1 Tax=Formimonas warabiya TaxID=1761012 RepID=A0A3G1KWB9_FORW1|nr:D-2-hydroxyacid dehydrogenase [Candidatus Formimonas warabiya]ATW26687.1 hypothetical protein DCMF_19710 [Candidatus Formimonas warabiya]